MINKKSMKGLQKNAFLNALGTAAYVTCVALLMNGLSGNTKGDTMFTPIFVLMLLVLSVAVVGSLIFGKPVLTYLGGQKEEAVKLLVGTIVWVAVFTVVALGVFLVSVQ